MGKKEKILLAAAKEAGNPPPKFYRDKPLLCIESNYFWETYCELSTDREDRHIPWRTLHDFAVINISSPDSHKYDDFFYTIRFIERDHLEYLDKKADETKNN